MKYQDVADLEEDQRIIKIGNAARLSQTVAFVTDADPPEKVERYVAKLLKLFPDLEVIDRFNGPVPNTVSVKVRKKVRPT